MKAAIEIAILKARASKARETVQAEKGEAYAYPHRDGTAWGVNAADGRNVLRGIRRPDGTDIAVS